MSGSVTELEPPEVAPPGRKPPKPLDLPGWALVAGGLLVTIVLFGLLTVDKPGPGPTTSVPTTADPIVAPDQPTSIEMPPIEWAEDLVGRSPPDLTWFPGRFEGADIEIADFATTRGAIVAVGRDRNGPASWTSNGGSWTRHDLVDDQIGRLTSSIDVVAASKDGLIGAGTRSGELVRWTSTSGRTWESAPLGLDSDPDRTLLMDLASSGDRTLLLAAVDGPSALWVSTDDERWFRATSPMLENAEIQALTFDGERFVAVGSTWIDPVPGTPADAGAVDPDSVAPPAYVPYAEGRLVPAIWTSIDGFAWSQSIVEQPGAGGTVVGIAPTDTGWVAVGTGGISSRFGPLGAAGPALWTAPETDPLVWTSVDGQIWILQELHAALTAPTLTVTLAEIRPSVAGYIALLAIGDQLVVVESGDDIGGALAVGEVTRTSVELTESIFVPPEASPTVLDLEGVTTVTYRGAVEVEGVAAVGRRVAMVGNIFDPLTWEMHSVSWTSLDAGTTWSGTPMALTMADLRIVTFRERSVVIGSALGDLRTGAQVGMWNTTAAEQEARAVVHRLFLAAQHGDAARFAASLPETMPPGEPQGTMVWPSPLTTDLAAWYPAADDGVRSRDDDAIATVTAHAAALNSRLDLEQCRVSVRIADDEAAAVSCDATYGDDLLDRLYGEELDLRVDVDIEGGAIVDVEVISAGTPWVRFTRWLERARPDVAARTLVVSEAAVVLPAAPGAVAAAAHMTGATDLVATWLEPGTPLTTHTPIGTIEWSWGTRPEGLAEIGDPIWTGDRFTVTSWGSTSITWESPDGVTWTASAQEPGEGLMRRFASSPLGPLAFGSDAYVGEYLRYLEGGVWHDIEFAESTRGWITQVGASDDALVVTTTEYVEEPCCSETTHLWRWDTGSSMLVPVEVPWTADPSGGTSLDSGAFGIMAFVDGWTDHAQIWVSTDGASWRLLLSAPDVGMSQLTGGAYGADRIVVVGAGTETVCRAAVDEGGTYCSRPALVAVSDDGTTWRVSSPREGTTIDEFSVAVGGPLGYAAWGWGGPDGSGDMWLSADGLTWDPVEVDVAWTLGQSGIDSNWVSGIAVGEDRIVAVLTTLEAGDLAARAQILVGRLVEDR